MPEYAARLLLRTDTVSAWDVVCPGLTRDRAEEESAPGARFVFPYRGVYVHAVGLSEYVADANHVVIVNADEPYQVSHPVDGGDATLTIGIDPVALHELAPPQYLSAPGRLASNCRVLRIDAHTQITAAQLRQRLVRCTINPAAAETLALDLIRHTLSANGSHTARNRDGRPQRMVDRVKLLLSADPSRKWALEEIAQYIGVTPVYLTDAFRRVEGIPFYRYHIRLRLVHSLAVLADYDTVESLAHRFGFHSHSHFSSAFKQAFQQTPSEFKRSISPGGSAGLAHREIRAVDDARVYVSRALRASKPCS